MIHIFSHFFLQDIKNVAAVKAEIVGALKNVSLDLQYGAKIAEILAESSVWAQYKDQRHDLFIPANNVNAIAGKIFAKMLIFFR